VAILIAFQKRKWKKIVVASCVPFLFIALWYTKNAFIFGTFSSSSWIGMNLSRITIRQLPEDKRESLAREGEISKLSLIIPFSHIEKYRPYLTKIRKTGVEVLDREKKISGASNLNNIAYIEISRLYLRDDLYVITSYPRLYLSGMAKSYGTYFLTSSQSIFLAKNLKHIQFYDKCYNIIVYGRFLHQDYKTLADRSIPISEKFFNVGLFLLVSFIISIFYGFLLIFRALFRNPTNVPFALTLTFVWITIAYVTVIGNSLELGENNRFRFMIDPLLLVILGLVLDRGLRKLQHWLKGHRLWDGLDIRQYFQYKRHNAL
jgi:hypothetical protein